MVEERMEDESNRRSTADGKMLRDDGEERTRLDFMYVVEVTTAHPPTSMVLLLVLRMWGKINLVINAATT
jgi:hypothetical protein